MNNLHKFIELGGKEWVKDNLHRIYFNKEVLLKLINLDLTFYNSGNISSASLNGEIIPIADAELLYRDLDGRFYFNVNTEAWNWKDISDRTAHILRDAILSHITPEPNLCDPLVDQKPSFHFMENKIIPKPSSKTPMSIRYRNHVESICRNHDIKIIISPGREGRSWTKSRTIRISQVKTSITYALALHEIGHILGVRSGKRLEKEVQAWEWAIRNAIEWTQPMQQAMERRLASYLRWCERSKIAWVPPADHPAWKLANVQPKI